MDSRTRRDIQAWLLANPAQGAPTRDALGVPRMSAMVDLGDFNNPPPAAPMPPSVDEFNAAMPLPVPPAYAPPPRRAQMPVPLPARGGLTADDLNAMSLAMAQGGAMPADYNDAQKAAWARIDGRMKA